MTATILTFKPRRSPGERLASLMALEHGHPEDGGASLALFTANFRGYEGTHADVGERIEQRRRELAYQLAQLDRI